MWATQYIITDRDFYLSGVVLDSNMVGLMEAYYWQTSVKLSVFHDLEIVLLLCDILFVDSSKYVQLNLFYL